MPRALPLALLAAALLVPASSALAAKRGYRAEIRRTTGGIPHVKARDYGSLGYGYGYAYAQDQLCEFANIVVTVGARRSRYFGAEGESPNGGTNLQSDFFWKRIHDARTVERLARRKAPHGPAGKVRRTVKGFVAGYNAYLRRTGRAKLPDPTCRGKAWVRPISTRDVYRRFYQLALRASSGNFLREIVDAAPPGPAPPRRPPRCRPPAAAAAALGGPRARDAAPARLQRVRRRLGRHPRGALRCCWATRTSRGRAPSAGTSCTSRSRASSTRSAPPCRARPWSTSASTGTWRSATRCRPRAASRPTSSSWRPGDPSSYLVDGRAVRMRRRTVSVRTRGGVRRHTFYETRWGPVFDFPAAGLEWTAKNAYALADVNADNFRLTNQWAEYDRARSVGDLRRASAKVQGNPWVNVIAADSQGRAYYADDSVVPNVDAALQRRCSTSPKAPLLLTAGGVILLDGSTKSCAWGRDRDAVARGILGPKALPRATRRDYVENSNDSYWLPSAASA